MFSKLVKILTALLLLMDALGPGAFAQALAPTLQPPVLTQSAAVPYVPEGSAPLQQEAVSAFTPAPAVEAPAQKLPDMEDTDTAGQNPYDMALPQPFQAAPEEEKPYFEDPQNRAGLKLFEVSRYELLQDDAPMMLPPPVTEEEDGLDNYYRYSRKYLENIINESEGGIELKERGIEYLEILNPSLLVPIYGTTISLTGRKTFGLNFAAKKYKGQRTVDNRSTSGMNFTQEMQIKLQGKISDRIFVDIDYDDQRQDAQNISLAYRGKGEEFVQSADFGDIELSLPSTHFLSYSKQVFGAKMHMKYGNANLRIIGSQTKGDTKSKQFKGDSVFETVNIKDIQYIRRKYYDLTFGGTAPWTSTIVPGSEKVYLDDHTNGGYQYAMRAQDLAVPASVYPQSGGNGAFKLLTRGVDYTIDYNRNILIFNNSLRDTDVVAVDYTNNAGQTLSSYGDGYAKLVKTPDDRPLASTSEIGYKLEIKRYYDIGAKQISRDNGQGNFILRLLESDGREACPASGAPGYCQFSVDYDKGIFEIFSEFPDPGMYAPTPTTAANRYFFVQFSSSVRTYFLEPDIVVQSETIKINGATLARNMDYYVDYASGYITFYKEELIGPGSVIDVTYETSNGGMGDSALLGGRFNYDFTRNISVGASILNEGGSQPKRVPNVGALTNSLTVMEADIRAKDVELADGVKISLGAEVAQSKKDENLFGYAMIDNMEETKSYVKASTSYADWQISSNPGGKSSFFDAVKWDSEEIKTLDINRASAARLDAKQVVLDINYDFRLAAAADAAGRTCPGGPCADRDEVSIVFPISAQGADFTKKTQLELSMEGEAGGPQLNITFGTVDERSDRFDYIPPGFSKSDIYPECSKYYDKNNPSSFYVPKTEDLRCTGLLTPSEDAGWLFVNPDGTYQRYDPFRNNQFNRDPQPNGRTDTQDLNSNGLFDSEDLTAGGNFGFAGTAFSGDIFDRDGNPVMPFSGGSTINYDGWFHLRQEADFSDSLRWGSVRQMRITLKKSALSGAKDHGTIRIANLAVSGSTWQPLDTAATGDAIVSYGINNIDNSTYKPIFSDNGDGGEVFRYLYGSVNDMRSDTGTNNIKEQSLALQYDFGVAGAPQDLNVQNNFSPMDFSQHKQFRFLVYNNGPAGQGVSFYLRVATDDNNYSEIEIPLDFKDQWRLYSLKLIDTAGGGVPTVWESNSKYPLPAANVRNIGVINFKRVGTVKTGVRADGSNPLAAGEVWLDEVHLADSVVTTGGAYMAEAKIDVDNWFEAGGRYTYMDRNFQTPVSVPGRQDSTREDYYLKLKRLKNFPVLAEYYRSETLTPDALGYDKSNTVSLLDQGKVNRDGGSVKAQYLDPAMPNVNMEYSFNNADYEKLQRTDGRKAYSASIDYTPRTPKEPVVKNITAGASFAQSKISYGDAVSKSAPSSYYNTDESTQNYNLKLSLQPWRGASVVPSYSFSSVDEKRRFYDASQMLFREKDYSKSASENVGVSAALRLNNWLVPIASYTVNISENNNLSQLSYHAQNADYTFDIGEVKSITRMSEGNISLALNGKEFLPKSKLFSGFTVSGSYKLQDGDTWENVDDDFNSLDKVWIRSSMGLNSPYTYRSKLTLRDTYTSTLRWVPFREYDLAGASASLKTLSVINNFTKSYQTTEDLGSAYKSESTTLPDLILFIDEVEKFFGSPKYVTGANIKLKYNITDTEVIGSEWKEESSYGGDFRFVLFNYFDNTISYTQQTLDKNDIRFGGPLEDYLRRDFTAQTSFTHKKVRFTPKFTYLYDTRTQMGDTLVNEVNEIVPSLSIRADFNMPFGLKLPFISRRYLITNRVVWNTNVSYSRRRSFTVQENRDLFDVNTNFDYEVSKNIRLSVSGAFQNFKHVYIEEESYTAYTIGTLMTIQF